jgi:diguanylate cyclase (GGDEF)-like protein
MLDVRTLFVVMIATCLLLAASMAVAVGFRFRDGVGKWTVSLLLQAMMFVLFLSRGVWPDVVSVIIPNTLLTLCLSLQAAAILEFYGRRLPVWWHIAPPAAIAVLLYFLMANLSARILVTAVCFGGGMLICALLLQRLQGNNDRPARMVLMSGFLLAAITLVVRAVAMGIDRAVLKDFVTPTALQGGTFLAAFAVILLTSMGFLLLQMERAQESAQRLALTDPLTGTFNRRTFLELGAKEIARTRRSKGSLCLLMLDLDLFKRVNDQYGHIAGDEALKTVVNALQACLRREDLLVRYGGEEFCVLLPEVSLDHAALLAERSRAAVEAATLMYRGQRIPLTISIGVALLMSGTDETIEQLVSRADEALYSAKAAGRNRVVVYPENSTIALLSRSKRRNADAAAATNAKTDASGNEQAAS